MQINDQTGDTKAANRPRHENGDSNWDTWKSPLVIISMVIGSDLVRWLLERYTPLSSISRHVVSLVVVIAVAMAFEAIQKGRESA